MPCRARLARNTPITCGALNGWCHSFINQERQRNEGKELAWASYQAAVIASGYSFCARASHSDAATSSEFQKEDRDN